VPTQRKPSRVCMIVATESEGRPLAGRQTLKVPAVSAKSKPESSAGLLAGKSVSKQTISEI